MQSLGIIDVAALLAALPDGAGAGNDLRLDYSPTSPYQNLRDARAEARASEREQDSSGGPVGVPPQWRDVRRLATLCLAEKAKDFEVACWLAEALVRLDGLAGLHDAALLLDGLLEHYWDNGFPQPDEDGLSSRVAPLAGLAGGGSDGTLMQPLRRIGLFPRGDGSSASLHVWIQAEETAKIGDPAKRAARLKAGAPEFGALGEEARAGLASLRAAAAAARLAGAAWERFTARLGEQLGREAPPTRRVADALQEIVAIAERIGGPLADAAQEANQAAQPMDMTPAVAVMAGPPAANSVGDGGATGGAWGAIVSRNDAIRRIEEVAAFFCATEPHSPVGYTLAEAARRARLPLPELLAEVLPDAGARGAMLTMLGIRSLSAPAAAAVTPAAAAAAVPAPPSPTPEPAAAEGNRIVW